MMRTSEEAFRAAVASGAVEAYAEGRAIQWKLDIQDYWKTFDTGGLPEFFSQNVEWRVAPPPPPIVFWRNVKQYLPNDNQVCLISDGKTVKMDKWIENEEDWRKRGKAYYPFWSPLPEPGKANL